MPKESLLAALKRKYATPEEALIALGLTSEEVAGIAFDAALERKNTMYRPHLAHDQAPRPEACINAVRAMVADMDDEERRDFLEQLAEIVGNEPANEQAMDRAIVARRRARLAQDEARRVPMTARDARRFDETFPSAKRIGFA